MNRMLVAIVILLLVPLAAFAQESAALNAHTEHMSPAPAPQDWAKQRLDKSPRHQEWVSVKNGQRTVNSFIVYPTNRPNVTVKARLGFSDK